MLKEKVFSTLQNKKVKDFFIYGIGQVVNILTPLLITPFLIYICGLEKLGIIAMGQAFAYILIVIVDYSSYIIGVKEISINRNDPTKIQNLFTTIYTAKFFLLLIVCIFTLLLTFLLPFFRDNSIVFYYSLTIIVAQFINPTWFFQGVENFIWITIINVISKALHILFVFFLINSESDYVYANLFLGVGAIFGNLIGFLWIIKKYNFKLQNISLQSVYDFLKKDFSFCVSQLFFAIRNYSSVMIIGFFAGNYVAGQFKVIEQIINLFRTYLQLFFKFSYSYVCFELDKSLKEGLKLWQKLNFANIVFLLLLLTSVFIFTDAVLLFFKVDSKMIIEFAHYLHIALLIPVLIGITLPLEQLLFGLNKNRQYIRITIFSTILNAIALSVTMMYFGLNEAFFLLIITELCLVFIYLLILKPYFSPKYSSH